MMKYFFLIVMAVSFSVKAEMFVINPKNGTTVDVVRKGSELTVVCRFPEQTKFDSAINAKLNDQKSQNLFIMGLERYFKVGPMGEMQVSGRYSRGVKKSKGFVSYSYGVPVVGCKVVEKPKERVSSSVSSNLPPVIIKGRSSEISPIMNQSSNETSQIKGERNVIKSKGFLSIVKYSDVEGQRKTITKREYASEDFETPEQFIEKCRAEFDRVNAIGMCNILQVLKMGNTP